MSDNPSLDTTDHPLALAAFERATRATTMIEQHEKVCAERWAAIASSNVKIEEAIKELQGRFLAVSAFLIVGLLGVCGSLIVYIFTTLEGK